MKFEIDSKDLEEMMMDVCIDMRSIALALYLYGSGMGRECALDSLTDEERKIFERIVGRSEHRCEEDGT